MLAMKGEDDEAAAGADADVEDKQLTIDEMYTSAETFMLAGSETAASALSGATYYLLKNPEKMARLTKEIRGKYDSDAQISFDGNVELKYLNACLQEALGMYPPALTILPRLAQKGGIRVSGHFVPEGVSWTPQ
jgi:cytochrome P450